MTASEGIQYASAIDWLVYRISVDAPEMGPLMHYVDFNRVSRTLRQWRYGPRRWMPDS